MSEHIDRGTLNQLLNCPKQSCLSLYMPTYRAFPDSTQNPTRYRNLLSSLGEQLAERFPDADHAALLEPFERLEQDQDFWLTPRDGLAILAGENFFHVFKLTRTVRERAVASDQPYLSPVLRITQAGDNFQLLCLSRDEVRLFEGNRDALHEVQLDYRVPASQTDALGSELTPQTQSGHPGGYGPAGERGDPMTHSAAGPGKQEEIDKDREKFFRAVDKAIDEYHSKPSGLPLMLVALPDNQSFFRGVSHNQQLTRDRIETDPSGLDAETLKEKAAEVMERKEVDRLNALHDKYGAAEPENRTSDDLQDIGKAAFAGRVETLLINEDKTVPGTLDEETGAFVPGIEGDGTNVLDDIAVAAMRNGAEVMIVPAQRMPSTSSVAAVLYS